ncbi:MAG: DUF1778 domain-containing protein [Stellaceae bacterium]
MVKRAAEIQGRSVSDFVVAAAQEAAHRTIEETEIICLSIEDQRLLAEALFNPPEPAPAMLSAAVEQAGLAALFEHVLSVEEVAVCKPHPKVRQIAVDRLAMPAEALASVSSNGWDASWAASPFGMRAIWCNRSGQRPSGCSARPTIRSVRLPSCRRCPAPEPVSGTGARSAPAPPRARGFWRR